MVFSLDAVPHKELPFYTKLFSIHDMEYYLWIKVQPSIAKEYRLYQIDEVGSKNVFDLSIPDICSHELGRVWFKFNSMYLNRDAGQHVYRMHFVHMRDDHTISLYFSYIVQTEVVDKSYVYMKDIEEVKLKL